MSRSLDLLLERPKPKPGYPKPGFWPRNPYPGFVLGKTRVLFWPILTEILLKIEWKLGIVGIKFKNSPPWVFLWTRNRNFTAFYFGRDCIFLGGKAVAKHFLTTFSCEQISSSKNHGLLQTRNPNPNPGFPLGRVLKPGFTNWRVFGRSSCNVQNIPHELYQGTQSESLAPWTWSWKSNIGIWSCFKIGLFESPP